MYVYIYIYIHKYGCMYIFIYMFTTFDFFSLTDLVNILSFTISQYSNNNQVNGERNFELKQRERSGSARDRESEKNIHICMHIINCWYIA